MDFNAIIKRVTNLIFKPAEEWDTINGESTTLENLYLKYAIILFAIPAVGFFLGMLFAFRGHLFGRVFVLMIIYYIFSMGAVFLLGLLCDVLGVQFGAQKDAVASHKLTVYSLTPYAVVGALFILLGFIGAIRYIVLAASLYSFYLFYLGAPKIKGIAKDKMIPFTVIMAVIWIVLIFLAGEISARIVF